MPHSQQLVQHQNWNKNHVRWGNVNLFIFWSQWGLLRVQVRLWGEQRLSSFGKHYKNIPVCVTLGFILMSFPPLLSVTGMLKFNPNCLMLIVALMMVTAALCIAGKSPLVHIFVSALLPSILFFLSAHHFLPSFWSIWSIARKLGNQSGRFLSSRTVFVLIVIHCNTGQNHTQEACVKLCQVILLFRLTYNFL